MSAYAPQPTGPSQPGLSVQSCAAALGQTQGLVAGLGGLGTGENTASIVPVGPIRARPVGRTHDHGHGHGQDLDSARFDTKKRPSLLEEQARSDVAQARADWLAERPQPVSGQGRLIFLDETWATTCMTPIWGRSPKGERCLGHAPFGHWHTTTFVCALEAPVDCWRRWCLTDRSMVLHL